MAAAMLSDDQGDELVARVDAALDFMENVPDLQPAAPEQHYDPAVLAFAANIAAAEISSSDDDSPECWICREHYTAENPSYLLPCGHELCENCLFSLFALEYVDDQYLRVARCPNCRQRYTRAELLEGDGRDEGPREEAERVQEEAANADAPENAGQEEANRLRREELAAGGFHPPLPPGVEAHDEDASDSDVSGYFGSAPGSAAASGPDDSDEGEGDEGDEGDLSGDDDDPLDLYARRLRHYERLGHRLAHGNGSEIAFRPQHHPDRLELGESELISGPVGYGIFNRIVHLQRNIHIIPVHPVLPRAVGPPPPPPPLAPPMHAPLYDGVEQTWVAVLYKAGQYEAPGLLQRIGNFVRDHIPFVHRSDLGLTQSLDGPNFINDLLTMHSLVASSWQAGVAVDHSSRRVFSSYEQSRVAELITGYFDSYAVAGVSMPLFQALFDFTNNEMNNLNARVSVNRDDGKICPRDAFADAARRAAASTPIGQRLAHAAISVFNNTVNFYVQQKLIGDILGVMARPAGSGLVFRGGSRSGIVRTIAARTAPAQ